MAEEVTFIKDDDDQVLDLDSYSPTLSTLPTRSNLPQRKPAKAPLLRPSPRVDYQEHRATFQNRDRFQGPRAPTQIRDIDNCLDIAYHIRHCPICSEHYRCDRTYLVICVAALIVGLVVLAKYIIDKK